MIAEQSGTSNAYTIAAMPAASAASGVTIYNSDLDVMMRSNGTSWIPLAPFVAYSSGALTAAHTGNTDKTLVATVSLGSIAQFIGPNGRVRIHAASTNTNNGNAKTLTIAMYDGTTEVDIMAVSSTTTGKTVLKSVISADSLTSQWFNNSGSSAESSVTATATASTLNYASGTLDVKTYMTLASGGDTATLTRMRIEVNPGF